MQVIKAAFKNTLWLLTPSVVLAFFMINSGPFFWAEISTAYYVLFLPNFSFFFGSLALFMFLERGFHKISSITFSLILGIGLWFVLFSYADSSNTFLRFRGNGVGHLFTFGSAIIALIIFFLRAVMISTGSMENVPDNFSQQKQGGRSWIYYVCGGVIILILSYITLLFALPRGVLGIEWLTIPLFRIFQ